MKSRLTVLNNHLEALAGFDTQRSVTRQSVLVVQGTHSEGVGYDIAVPGSLLLEEEDRAGEHNWKRSLITNHEYESNLTNPDDGGGPEGGKYLDWTIRTL